MEAARFLDLKCRIGIIYSCFRNMKGCAVGLITLTTDFGLADPFAGVMKGVILGIDPGAVIVDLTHQVPSFDVEHAAWLLHDSCRYFPDGSIHVAVVDPGVGSSRRPILVEGGGQYFVGPDNGIFSFFLDGGTTYHLTESRYFLPDTSATFHGRDIFAPVAAHLSKGVMPREMGRVIADPVRLDLPRPVMKHGKLKGVVISLDRYGNAVTNLVAPPRAEQAGRRVSVRGHRLGFASCYADVRPGEAAAIGGSSGRVEIFVNQGSAAALLGIMRGDEVSFE